MNKFYPKMDEDVLQGKRGLIIIGKACFLIFAVFTQFKRCWQKRVFGGVGEGYPQN
jgi:hypothetical protein